MDNKQLESFYIYLNSEQTAQKYLLKNYQQLKCDEAEKKSYQNCRAFLYYLDHGEEFYQKGSTLSLLFQPILYFYGMVHLLKAVLLTKRPDYPESTTMLAHGVSTRKRKKKAYQFVEDEVKIQHKGLFPYFSEHLFNISSLPFDKISMRRLLGLIPEMSPLFNFHDERPLIHIGKVGEKQLIFPFHILDNYHLTKHSFINRILPYLPHISTIKSTSQSMILQLACPFSPKGGPFFIHENQSIYFPAQRNNFLPITEVMAHYLILYNLSMVSRYETEWWGDLLTLKPDIDFPLILQFLQTTAKKIPQLLGEELMKSN